MFKRSPAEKELLRPKKKSRKVFIILLILLAILGGTIYLVSYSPLFKVQRSEVHGSNLVSPEFLIERMAILIVGENYGWQILGADNILFWKFSKKPQIFATILPSVSAIDLDIDFLKRTVNFLVKERRPLGVWCRAERECYGFDENGVIFGKAPSSQGVLILRVDDETGAPIILGRQALPKKEWWENLLHAVGEVKAKGFQITSLKVEDLDLREWQIGTSAGITMLFSFNFVPENLGKILESLKERLSGSKVKVLDFRVPNRIYYR